MTERVETGGLTVAQSLHEFIDREALPGTGVTPQSFWSALGAIVEELSPVNRRLLETRDRMQSQIDAWHRERRGRVFDRAAY